MSTQCWPFTGAVRRAGTWRHLRLPRSIIGQRNQRQIAFSFSWTRQKPRVLVGSSVVLDPAVPGLNCTVVNCFFLCVTFFLKVRTAKISKSFTCTAMASADARQWSLQTSQQVIIGFKNLPAGYYRDLQTSGQSMWTNGRLATDPP